MDRASPVPLYFQVATRLQQLIEEGEIPLGTRLENEIDLADQVRVSRPTMRRAIQYLVERGMLVRKRGVGTQVVHPSGGATTARAPRRAAADHDPYGLGRPGAGGGARLARVWRRLRRCHDD